jgi:hypothetical protein
VPDNPTISDTVERVRSDLKNEGKTLVSLEKEANGSEAIAEAIIRSAASIANLTVQTKVNKKSVSGKVVTDS